MDQDHPEIPLEYLPVYQRERIKETIAADSLDQARAKVDALGAQAETCRIVAERRKAQDEQHKQDQQLADGKTGTTGDKPSGTKSPKPSDSPTPGPQLSEHQRELAKQCAAPQE